MSPQMSTEFSKRLEKALSLSVEEQEARLPRPSRLSKGGRHDCKRHLPRHHTTDEPALSLPQGCLPQHQRTAGFSTSQIVFTIRCARNDRSIHNAGIHNREGHEFHSCRTGIGKISGFSRWGVLLVCTRLNSQPQRLKAASHAGQIGTSGTGALPSILLPLDSSIVSR